MNEQTKKAYNAIKDKTGMLDNVFGYIAKGLGGNAVICLNKYLAELGFNVNTIDENQIMVSLIEDEIGSWHEAEICPYCGDETSDWNGCCGESSAHFETVVRSETRDYTDDEADALEEFLADTTKEIEQLTDCEA